MGSAPIRLLLGAILLLATLYALTWLVPDSAGPSAIRLIVASLTVGLLPGLIITAWVNPFDRASVLEWIAVGFGASIGVIQVLTVLAITFHIASPWALAVLLTGSVAGLVYLLAARRNSPFACTAGPGEWILGSLIIVACACVYVKSPEQPWFSGEDAIHVSVIRRLASVDRPAINNIYWAPAFPYTYPFPATHYFMALVSRAADLDPLFVYQKLRWLWTLVGLSAVAACARILFASRRAAYASGLVATLLTLNGTFGPISGTWGQLVPASHASDVAMSVLLPVLLVYLLHFAMASDARRVRFYFTGAMALVLTLTIVHIREVVQVVVYGGAAAATYALLTKDRVRAWRFAIAVATTIVMVALYLQWHHVAVGHVDEVVSQRRVILVEAARVMPFSDWWSHPFTNPYFSTASEYFFFGWFPLVLLLAPVALARYRSAPLVPFLGAAMLAYALIVRLPVLAVPYIYFTYYEILFTPVRNVLFFIYLLGGPLLLVATDLAGRVRPAAGRWAAAIGIGAVTVLLYRTLGGFLAAKPDAFYLSFIVFLALALVAHTQSRAAAPGTVPGDDEAAVPAWLYAALVVIAVGTFRAAGSPLVIDAGKTRWTARDYLAAIPEEVTKPRWEFVDPVSGAPRRMLESEIRKVAPSPDLVAWARHAMPSTAVVVCNIFNTYAPPVFLPVQMPMWPMVDGSTPEFDARLFPTQYAAFDAIVVRHEAQPFFNTRETLEERLTYVRAVGATHVILDPMYYDRIRPLLRPWAEAFKPVYDDGERWAVFEVADGS